MSCAAAIVRLTDPLALDPDLVGAKAANLARCAAAGLPVLPGIVLTTAGAIRIHDDPDVREALRHGCEQLRGPPERPLVVRSSSTVEDMGTSSMAGRFVSVLDVRSWDTILDATDRVLASAGSVQGPSEHGQPMAVLVQPQLAARVSGVMFGVDPVTGARDHLVVEAVRGSPDALVGGQATADHWVLTRRGRVLDHVSVGEIVELDSRTRRRLAHLAAHAAAALGGPQDIEWAVGEDGTLSLLQSRPVTAMADAVEQGARLGPGPVAETFPDPLRPLEQDLWIVPLREGIVRALRASGAVSERSLTRSPVVTCVGGRAAVDLDLLGVASGHIPWTRRIHPVEIGRRLVVAWRVGRLRVALPRLAETVVATVDRDLDAVGDLGAASPEELAGLVQRALDELATVHAYEILCGMLLRESPGDTPAPLVALHELHVARAAGLPDDVIVWRSPVVLCLVPPSLDGPVRLPADTWSSGATTTPHVSLRDQLRLRARWLQELQVRAARRIGGVAHPPVPSELLPFLRADELTAVALGAPVPAAAAARAVVPPGPPLPTVFHLGSRSQVVPDRRRAGGTHAGLAAGGGRATGVAVHRVVPGATRARTGTKPILVVHHLEPRLAGVLPEVGGLVAETGSALSHLAILAREMGVATVAGVPRAVERFPAGCRLLVDGDVGTVDVLADADQEPEPLAAAGTATSRSGTP